jgi:phage I-like protein
MFPLREKSQGDDGIRALARIAGTVEADGTRWQQIAYEGEWYGHSNGDFQLTAEIFDQIIKNFDRREDDVPVIYGHPGVGSTEAAHMGAAGWISELRRDVDDKGRQALFARVKWTERTAAKIKADEYRYCSVVIYFDSVDEVTGENIGPELLELGVVPAAFLDGMTRLAASRAGRAQARALARKDLEMSDKELIAKAMKELGDDFTLEQLLKVVEAEKQKQAALSGDASEDGEEPAEDIEASDATGEANVVEAADMPTEDVEGAPSEEQDAARGAAADVMERLAEMKGVDLPAAIAFVEEMLEQIATMPDGEAGAPMAEMSKSHSKTIVELGKVSKRVAELEARDAAREIELQHARFDVSLSRHVTDGHITDAEANAFREMSTDEDYGAQALTVATKALSKRLKGAPAAPKGRVYKAGKPSDGPRSLGVEMTQEEAMSAATDAVKKEAAKEGVSLSRKDLRSRSYAYAKANFPEALNR